MIKKKLADSVNKDGSADNCDFELNTIKGIKLAHLNVRSLANKVADLQNWLSNNPYDLLGLSETWLTEEHSDSLFSIKGYKFERRDRGTHWGGGCFISKIFLTLEDQILNLLL